MNLNEACTLTRLTSINQSILNKFDCDHDDLNDFFNNDAINYYEELLGVTYAFVLKEDSTIIISVFTLSNDAINVNIIPNSRKKKVNSKIPGVKRNRSYPSVKIGRLGVNKDFSGKGLGIQTIDFIKSWFVLKNKTGCRFITVDSYNEKRPISFYQKCGFDFLFSTEEQEKECLYDDPTNITLNSRQMRYDLINILRT